MAHESPKADASQTAEMKPYISADQSPPESTIAALITGSLLGIVFAASSVYLGLKVGLTVSASIPIAVISITIFNRFAKGQHPRILVNNIVQTTGSAGESIAAGVAFTLPSLLLMGFDMEIGRILLVALLGGVLGVLMMIPLRHGLIVKEHGKLTYPEGTACAQVLVVGETGGVNAKTVFQGFGFGLVHAIFSKILRFWWDEPEYVLKARYFNKGSMSGELSAPMLGVGYIIGFQTSAVMMAGGVLSFLILVPMIQYFGSEIHGGGSAVAMAIAKLPPGDIRDAYLLYIGAGAVATGGFISLARSIPTIFHAFRAGLSNIGVVHTTTKRTEQDLSMKVVLFGSIGLVLAIALAPMLEINVVSAVLIVLFGFFFVTVSSRITGEIGSSSNPISGMTIATLLITCLLFKVAHWTGVSYKAMALTTAALVCVAASNGGTISQDLKTGFLVGATPRKQQIAILIGVLTSAFLIGVTLLMLNRAYESKLPVDRKFSAYTVPATLPHHVVFGRGNDEKPVDPLADAAKETFEKNEYATYFVREVGPAEKAAGVERGKYLVDPKTRKLAFLVNPGVCGKQVYDRVPLGADAPKYGDFPTRESQVADDVLEEYDDNGVVSRVVEDEKTKKVYLLDDEKKAVISEAEKHERFNAPKARIFALIIDGILGGDLPWTLVLIGVMIAFMMELCGVSSLPFAVGVYLPLSASTPIFIGGCVRWLVDKKTKLGGLESESSPGTLFASGLIAGGSIGGLIEALMRVVAPKLHESLTGIGESLLGGLTKSASFPIFPFFGMAIAMLFVGLRAKKASA